MNDFLRLLYRNHVLANLTFVLVLVLGVLSYFQLPRQQDPTINFNWIVITTVLPGASALDVERKVTDPIEDALQKVQDIKFMSSNSREGVSSILVRFQDIDERIFDKRVSDLRREIQNKEQELPDAAEDPKILEITSANAYPSASIAVVGQAMDENLRKQARNIEKDLERIKGVDRVDPIGLPSPELRITFDPDLLESLRLTPGQLSDTVSAFFQDIATGDIQLGQQNWLVRLVGSDANPAYLASRPIIGAQGEVTLGQVARVERARDTPSQLTSYDGRPAVMLAVMKQANANTIDLVERIQAYQAMRNQSADTTGVDVVLIDDQTQATRNAITLMQNNALIGLILVLAVAWLFLGTRIAVLTAIGIPFILAGTFWILSITGETLNVMVLLGVVIMLGMLVDDAVVVVEGIYYRLQRGMDAMSASLDALREVAAPVTAAVLTTMAAFGPLIVLPGILGDFMSVVPTVVVIGLALSLLESFWMLPAHVIGANVHFQNRSRIQQLRERFTHKVQIAYVRILIKALRHRVLTLSSVFLLFVGAFVVIGAGAVKADFFAADNIRLFYVNVEMPPETPLESTLAKVEQIEAKVRAGLHDGEARALISYAGNMFTETAPRLGDHLGQILISLNPKTDGLRSVQQMIADLREPVLATPGPLRISFLRLAGGPPAGHPIDIKVRGDNYAEIRAAADALQGILRRIPGVIDIDDDAAKGRNELVLKLDADAINRAGLNPLEINRTLQLLVDGVVVSDMRADGEKLEVRVVSRKPHLNDISQLLNFQMPLPDGGSVALHTLLDEQRLPGLGNIRHHNFRRAITVTADLFRHGESNTFTDCQWPKFKDETPDWTRCDLDAESANKLLMDGWEQIASEHPNVNLAAEGELDDLQESMDSMLILFIAGLGVMYAILGTQFRSYFQPLMIISTVFMAFTGVTFGLLVTQNPLSLYTLYGVVALSGIAVNAAIVLISAGNQRLQAGMSVLHATLYAARRRVIPILITSLTTVAGLFSLATGLGGHSLIWGPVATAIVWGLAFSTVLTLIVIPLLYRVFMPNSYLLHGR